MENNEETRCRSASFFVTFFREKKVEFFSSIKTTAGRERVRARLSLWRSLSKNTPLLFSGAPSDYDFVWWWWSFGGVERLLLLSMCAFSLVVVQVKLFFPLYRRRACVYYHTQEQKRSSLLKFLFQQILTHWW